MARICGCEQLAHESLAAAGGRGHLAAQKHPRELPRQPKWRMTAPRGARRQIFRRIDATSHVHRTREMRLRATCWPPSIRSPGKSESGTRTPRLQLKT
eukprot:scaffold3131_cov112-Isochrysis_galbana.AAC.4